ncbi:hypothetical protein ACQPYK_28505 [Streptosporangium sp. CA-135522]|uniref:hypothetical protein n=1 Tax=Streptosporangium sp. CA-135522 TaxID=3240072 RepID=UPI003D8E1E10
MVNAPLLFGATTILYEGKPVDTPDVGAFWRVIERYDVKALFTAPAVLRAARKEDHEVTHFGDPVPSTIEDAAVSVRRRISLFNRSCGLFGHT